MSTRPTFRELIALRKRELENQLVAARGHVAEIEAEIAEVEQAEAVLKDFVPDFTLQISTNPDAVTERGKYVQAPETRSLGRVRTLDAMPQADRFAQMTIKQLVMQALRDKHPDGLTTTALREFIRDAYGRTIEQDSLRPQLLRLKTDDWIVARSDAWHLTKKALTYTHVRSMNIKDEPTDEELAREIKALGQEGEVSITAWRHNRPAGYGKKER